MVGVDVGLVSVLGLRVEGGKVVVRVDATLGSIVVCPRVVDGLKPSSKGVPGGVPWPWGSWSISMPVASTEVPGGPSSGR